MILLENTIREFLNNSCNYIGYRKSTVKNLLQSEKEYSLLSINGKGAINVEELAAGIKDSVSAYRSNKDSAIDIYKKYVKFLYDKYNINVGIEFPPIPVSITFERIMFIAKYLQDPTNKVSDLPDLLWVKDRTIEGDIAKLRGNTDDPIQVCGKKFIIEDLERSRGSITMPSTAHPIFLTSNLTEIIITLKGLKGMAQNSAYREYAQNMAQSIWTQLSDYAKNRILHVTENILPDELGWYHGLDETCDYSFSTEYMCRNFEGLGCVLDCLKNGKVCFIEYKENDSKKFYKNCEIISLIGKILTISCDGETMELNSDNVLRSSYTMEELI
ncbi:MAG: hypothetical protein WBJ17_02680 [Natronincolaceae bacterium]|jgi:hypothetical protein|nr:hypothetical protein [Bacillota bacterium]